MREPSMLTDRRSASWDLGPRLVFRTDELFEKYCPSIHGFNGAVLDPLTPAVLTTQCIFSRRIHQHVVGESSLPQSYDVAISDPDS